MGLLSNLGIMMLLIWSLGHVAIALATAGAAWINGGILCYILIKRGHFSPTNVSNAAATHSLCFGLMAVALWIGNWAAVRFVPKASWFRHLLWLAWSRWALASTPSRASFWAPSTSPISRT